MRPLLAVATEAEQGGIILQAEKFETRSVFEWVNRVFLGKADGMRAFECV